MTVRSTAGSRHGAARLALVLTMLGAFALGPAAAAFATPPASDQGEAGDCVSPDTLVREELTEDELTALLQGLAAQLGVAQPNLAESERVRAVGAMLLAGQLPDGTQPPADVSALADQVLARYQTLTVADLAQLLTLGEAALEDALGGVSPTVAEQFRTAFQTFTLALLTAVDYYGCDGASGEQPTEYPTATPTFTPEAPAPGATATPAAYPAATPTETPFATPESSTAGLADTGLDTPLLAGLVALMLASGAVLLAVTARARGQQ